MRVERDKPTRADPAPQDPLLGRVLDGYRIDERIGSGGMGVVYRATQLSLSRAVAVKFLPESLAADPPFLDRFRREVDVMSRLSHPNIVTVLERGERDGRPYLVMEFVHGTSLREVLRKGPLPAPEALVNVRAALAALEHAHRHGIVHRDIKPENILLATGGIVKVADFGLSRIVLGEDHTRLTHTHLVLGTYEYMAPEQREHAREADERSDLYAAGVVLYEAIAGELPIGHFPPLSRTRPAECDRRIDAIIEKSLEKSPERRYQDAEEMGAAVSRRLSHAAMPPPAPVPVPPPAPADREPERRGHGHGRHAHRDPMHRTGVKIACIFVALFAMSHHWRLRDEEWMWLGIGAVAFIWIFPRLGGIFRSLGKFLVVLLILGVVLTSGFLFVSVRAPVAQSSAPLPTPTPVFRLTGASPAADLAEAVSALLRDDATAAWLRRHSVRLGGIGIHVMGRSLAISLPPEEGQNVLQVAWAIGRIAEARWPGSVQRLCLAPPALEAQWNRDPPPAFPARIGEPSGR